MIAFRILRLAAAAALTASAFGAGGLPEPVTSPIDTSANGHGIAVVLTTTATPVAASVNAHGVHLTLGPLRAMPGLPDEHRNAVSEWNRYE